METFVILAKRNGQHYQLTYLAETMREAIDEFRLIYHKKDYQIVDCKPATVKIK